VTANEKGRLPKFGPQSAAIREARGIIDREHLAHALRAHFDPARRFQPSEEYDAATRTIAAETKRRISDLYSHYSIDATDPNAGVTLAYHLACDLIPRFNPMEVRAHTGARRRGRPKSVKSGHLALIGAIPEITDTAASVIRACRRLSKLNGSWKGLRPTVLQGRYYRWADTVRAESAIPFGRFR
jgi:hypothetical protein